MKKQQVIKLIETISPYDFDGSIQNAIKLLVDKEEEYAARGFSDVRFDYDRGHNYDDSPDIKVRGTRLETDAEFNQRIGLEMSKEEAQKARQLQEEKNEKELYLKLHKKWGDKL